MVERTALPDELIVESQGTEIFTDEQPRVGGGLNENRIVAGCFWIPSLCFLSFHFPSYKVVSSCILTLTLV